MSDRAGAPVVVRLTGQLGNKLFQLAVGRTLADRLGAPLRFEPARRSAQLQQCVGDACQVATAAELHRCSVYSFRYSALPSLAARRLRARSRELRGAAPRFFEPPNDGAYDPAFERLEAPCYLQGYFQLPQYFDAGLDQVRARVIDHLHVGPRWAATGARDAPVVGVHFRRGDFVGLGWALGMGYYDDALAVVREQWPKARIRVFSDDRVFATLVEEHLVGRGFTMAPGAPDPASDGSDHDDPTIASLVAMARCDHLVMANSTFSWWAAAIGDRLDGSTDRLVICPSVWHPGRAPNGLARPEWLVIDNDDL